MLSRYNRVNILTAFFVLLICSLSYYFIIRNILIQQIDKDLQVEEQEIKDYVTNNNTLPKESSYKGQEIHFKRSGQAVLRHFESTLSTDSLSNENKSIRQLLFPVTVSGILYKATVIKSQTQAEDLIQLIFVVTAGIFMLLLLVIAFINRFILVKLWQPFYSTLQKLTSFTVNDAQPMHLATSNVDEFNELNHSVTKMTERVSNEFNNLKSFTENASHEMQTPLAVINSKLDLLIQHSHEGQGEQLQAIYDSVRRLNKLNQTLLLLTKIDNRLYNLSEEVDLKKLLEEKFVQLEELVQARHITVTKSLADIRILMNYDLAEILINNLLNNAIKHNTTGGTIQCILWDDGFRITNTGGQLTFNETAIFERFQKGASSDGTGLGLAVVKQICLSSNFKVAYSYKDQLHTIELLFGSHQAFIN
ncbi:MAG: HAMP domain-containing histidine kinase [Chitinophagaceae bacterium]|nr:HAMP domain-containing histidine kinase [Chitinophagaceae bacterium]